MFDVGTFASRLASRGGVLIALSTSTVPGGTYSRAVDVPPSELLAQNWMGAALSALYAVHSRAATPPSYASTTVAREYLLKTERVYRAIYVPVALQYGSLSLREREGVLGTRQYIPRLTQRADLCPAALSVSYAYIGSTT